MVNQLLTPNDVDQAAELLLRGGIIGLPTDTVYGLAAHPEHPSAIERLFAVKERPVDKAIPILIADLTQLEAVTRDASTEGRKLAEKFWPGALTIVLWRKTVRAGEPETVAVRVPALDLARTLIRAAGGVLAVTSANVSGGNNCTTAREVLDQLGGRLDAIIDGGACPGGVESTVVDATCSPVRILRQGALSRSRIADAVPVRT
jgi:L-threonylcarbamoyladenylate synthase